MYVRRKGKNRILFFLGFLICVLPLILNFFFNQSVENVISSFYLEEEKVDEGISDILTKCLGSRTKINVVRATVDGLQNLRTVESVAALRGKKPEEIRG